MRHLLKKYVQRRPNATTAIVVFTKVYVERIFLFFLLPWVVKRGLFSTFIMRGLPVIAQSEKFLPKGVSFYPSISPFTMKAYEGYACKHLTPARRRREIAANHPKKKNFCLRRV